MRIVLILICGVILGAVGLSYLKSRHPDDTVAVARPVAPAPRATTTSDSPALLDRARDAASSAKDAISDKLDDWHLSTSDIRRDLEKGGEVVRTKARQAGSTIAATGSNAKIVGYIKTKYALDKNLSARAISVSCDRGKVVLDGTVANEALIGRAIALALDTDGVTEVKSRLKIAP